MIPKMMVVMHDPPNAYGDCYRACIASIIEVDTIDVPHPGIRGVDHWQDEIRILDRWLAERGYWIFGLNIKDEDLKLYQEYATGYYILGGRSTRAPHFVVARYSSIVHDPHPDGGGIVADEDGTWNMQFICYGARKKPPFPGRETQ